MITFSNSSDPGDKFFYIDDGSGLSSDGHRGVMVRCGSIDPPASGYWVVTGVITSDEIAGNAVPVLLIRTLADVSPVF